MNTDALRELRKMVAAGAFPGDIFGSSFGPNIAILTPYEAFSGSLDAAKELHERLLPGWSWRRPAVPWEMDSVAVQDPDWSGGDDEDEGGYAWFKGAAINNPARAWLLAILDALISKETDDADQ